MTQPANSPTLLHLPDVYEGYLTSTQLTEFFRDIRQFAEVLDVFCKSAPRTMSGLRDAKLENVEAELMSGRARAVQVRYRFEGKESNSFGPLTKGEWNNMFYKHLDHHLSQFGV